MTQRRGVQGRCASAFHLELSLRPNLDSYPPTLSPPKSPSSGGWDTPADAAVLPMLFARVKLASWACSWFMMAGPGLAAEA
jgi:hypothetical protein